MNRRSFLRNSALALFGFTVLPPATAYDRVWRATGPIVDTRFNCIMERPMEFRANAVGIYEQLKECSLTRVGLPNPPAIDLLNFFEDVNQIAKKRTWKYA